MEAGHVGRTGTRTRHRLYDELAADVAHEKESKGMAFVRAGAVSRRARSGQRGVAPLVSASRSRETLDYPKPEPCNPKPATGSAYPVVDLIGYAPVHF